jgi:5-methylcytosine-specific restriction endonuclease McrBC GTP-binding regulatory subunit McrB
VLTLEWLEENTLWPQERLTEIVQVLESKSPHVVLAGPPGTGKTWIAQLIARFITEDNPNHYRLVQFHPSYSYEAFIEGLRPVAENNAVVFTPVRGLILSIEEKHRGNERPFVIIVDEMNRANLPRVFGELMFLLEYRDREIDLQYTKAFRLPPTIKIIGTMNTADRSIRSIDVALRRRFDFFECPPDVRVLERYFTPPHVNEVPSLFEGFIELNKQLTASLDRHHTIGHTFFMKELLTVDDLLAIWRRKIKPLVEDYFFDQPDIAAAFVPERFWPELAE